MWMIGCRPIEMWAGAGRLGESVKDDMELLGLQPEWVIFRDMWRDIHGTNVKP